MFFFCFLPITALQRSAFDNKSISFEEHIKDEHNMWHYLYFIVLVKVKDPTEFTGPESYVYHMIKVGLSHDWVVFITVCHMIVVCLSHDCGVFVTVYHMIGVCMSQSVT